MLAVLGVRPVLLVGTRIQVDARLRSLGIPVRFSGKYRITDEATIDVVREVTGFAQSRIEGSLARGRARVGPTSGVGVDVVSGNFFYTAQPLGVRSGVDFGYTGEVRN